MDDGRDVSARGADRSPDPSRPTRPGHGHDPAPATPPARSGRPPARSGIARFALDTTPLQEPSFRRLWIAGAVAVVGSQLTVVAVPKQLYDLTGSSAWVGISGIFALVPLLIFGLLGGAIADRVDRRRLILLSTVGIGVTSLAFGVLALSGDADVWAVLVVLSLQQACFAVNQPARSAIIPRLVSAARLPSANALNTTVFNTGVIAGPLLAAVLLPVVSLSALYFIDAAGIAFAIAVLYRLPGAPAEFTRRRLSVLGAFRDVGVGFRYLSGRQVLLASFVVDIVAMVLGMPRALFPEMAEHSFGDPAGGGTALGLLNAGIGIGAILGGLTSGWMVRVSRQGRAVTLAIGVWGVAMVGFGLSGSLLFAVGFLALGGWADNVSAIFRSTILQSAADDELRGRLQGVFTVVVAGGPRLADLLHGTTAAALSAREVATAGGVAVIVVLTLVLFPLTRFWTYDAHRARPGPGPGGAGPGTGGGAGDDRPLVAVPEVGSL